MYKDSRVPATPEITANHKYRVPYIIVVCGKTPTKNLMYGLFFSKLNAFKIAKFIITVKK
jgi:hypothetical protein